MCSQIQNFIALQNCLAVSEKRDKEKIYVSKIGSQTDCTVGDKKSDRDFVVNFPLAGRSVYV